MVFCLGNPDGNKESSDGGDEGWVEVVVMRCLMGHRGGGRSAGGVEW